MYRTLHSFMLSSHHADESPTPSSTKLMSFGRFNARSAFRFLSIVLLASGAIQSAQAQYCKPTILGQERSNLSALPEVARSGVSNAVGRDQSVYQARSQSTGFHMQNGPLSADLSASGVEFVFNGNRWGMQLAGFGYGDRLRTMGSAAPTSSANRVEYRRGGLTEWYVNGPLGLEQGFTVLRAPGKANGEPLTVALALSGDLTASTDPAQKSLTLARNRVAVLRYSGLTAVDARGRELRAWVELADDQLRLRVEDAGARYPLTIDPLIQIANLAACDITDNGGYLYGYSAAISGDGNTVVIGAPVGSAVNSNAFPPVSGVVSGAAYVFVNPGGRFGWSSPTPLEAQAKLIPSKTDGFFGFAVSVSSNGGTIAVGTYLGGQFANGSNADDGYTPSAYLFLRDTAGPGGWTQSSPVTESAAFTPAGGLEALALSADGNTLVLGTTQYVTEYTSLLSLYVFVKPYTGWASTSAYDADLTEANPPKNEFTDSVSVSDDGSVIVGGDGSWDGVAPYTGLGTGSAFVFVRPASGWISATQSAQLVPSDGVPGDAIGASTAVSGDGNTVVVGAPGILSAGLNPGKAYIFTKPTNGWANIVAETAKLTPVDSYSGQGFGYRTVAVDDSGTSVGIQDGFGSIYLFTEPVAGWSSTTGAFQGGASRLYAMDSDGGLILATAGSSSLEVANVGLFQPVPAATDVSSEVTVTRSGYVLNLATGRYAQTVTVTNSSANTISGPISLVLDNLSSNASLFNATGTTSFAAPAGSPYITQFLSTGNLAPGQMASFSLQFTDPTRAAITYTTRVLAGTGAR